MSNQPADNKPSAAYYLTLIGGILGIIVGFFLLFILIGIWIIIANALMIVFAQRLMSTPEEHQKYGIYILILSIFSGLNILALIGGILALTYQPTPAANPYPPIYPSRQPQYPQIVGAAITKYCPQCGNPVGGEAQFCPKCGKQLSP